MSRMVKTETESVDLFLRSINIKFDADYPERIAHFQPTTKSVNLIQTLLDTDTDRAFFINAPYGSGKSLVASYLLNHIENRQESHEMMRAIATRFKTVSPELADKTSKRIRSTKRGLVVALHGHCESFSKELKNAILASLKRQKLGRQARRIEIMPANDFSDALTMLSELNEIARKGKIERVLLIWDEFGQHIETLVANGNVSALQELQTLAEFASRTRKTPFSIALLLHQKMMFYASHLPQTVRKEWSKIEGRFKLINFIEDSKELFRLIGQIISLRNEIRSPSNSELIKLAKEAKQTKQANLFKEFSQTELKDTLKKAYPIDPVSLYLLPRISARVAQNERTLFSFLASTDLSRNFDASMLYDYFSSSMQADTSHGGTSKQWLETESALSKVRGEEYLEKTLMIACLLSFGIVGERTSAGRRALELGVSHFAGNKASSLIDELIERKLLLYRKHSDDISVWHGTDVDIRSRLEEQKDKLRREFDLITFLAKETPPPIWRSVEHNDKCGVRRYFSSSYMTYGQLLCTTNKSNFPFSKADGALFYLIPESFEEIELIKSYIYDSNFDQRILLVVPNQQVPLAEAALEVCALLQLQLDSDLTSTDPLVSIELQHMTDDARAYLSTLMKHITSPTEQGQTYFNNQKEFSLTSAKSLRQKLSFIMDSIYSLTPVVLNEMIVRNQPSSVVINARKKLEMAILEHSSEKLFGIAGNYPDASMARTVLVNTGIYKSEGDRWYYAESNGINDKGLREVWGLFSEFLIEPSIEPKKFRPFFEKLKEPPYGMRNGLIPILLTAAFKAFPSARSLSSNGNYITDILPSVIEDLCKNPDNYELTVFTINDAKKFYLEGIHRLFSNVKETDIQPQTPDLVRECFDAISRWLTTLPSCALTTKTISKPAQAFQTCLNNINDPTSVLFDVIPPEMGIEIKDHEKLVTKVRQCKEELESSQNQYYELCENTIRDIFQHVNTSQQDIRILSKEWADCFPTNFINQIPDIVSKRFIEELKIGKDNKKYLMDSISILLTSKHLNKWGDLSIQIFKRELIETVIRLEDTLITNYINNKTKQNREDIVKLVSLRLKQKYEQIVAIIGEDKAQFALDELIQDRGESKHGQVS